MSEINVYSVVVKVFGLKAGETGKRWYIAYDDVSLNADSEESAKAKALDRAVQRVACNPNLHDLRFWLVQAQEGAASKYVKVTIQLRG